MPDVEPGVTEKGEPANPLTLEQTGQLLRTKLFVPPARPNRVNRPRLFAQIQHGLDKALILVSAPAGYGKTTLVSSWLHATAIASTWISLDEDDNDPIRFLHYFITALHPIAPAIQLDLLGVLQDTRPASSKLLLNIILNEIAGHAPPFVLVLDDFQVIHAQSILEILTHLLEHLPPQMHVALLSRSDPPLPLSRLRARNQLVELRAEQLRFTQEEIALFLNQAMGLMLSGDDILALEARTEGWIAGLQLASLALQAAATQDRAGVHGFVSAFTGSHYYIMDYLAEEVLRLQPQAVRSFLLQSSILDRMCGSLCEAVLGADLPGSSNGQAMLETLEQSNLFIVPLDDERHWYRYHHLFGDVLNRRLEQLDPHRVPDLHRRAAGWYEQNGYIFDAIRHSLLAGDRDRAAQLVDQNGCQLLMRGEVVNLLKWIEAVEPYSQNLPWVSIQKGWSLCLTGQVDRAGYPLDIAEKLISALEMTDDVRTMSGALTAARAYRANLQGETRLAAVLARQAIDDLPASNDLSCSLRSVATSILGDACWLEGNLAEAQSAYTEAVTISQAAGNIHMSIVANTNLADILMEQGYLHKAARLFFEILQMAKTPDGHISPLVEGVYAGLGSIAYEWNHLEDAERDIQQCIQLSQQWENFVSLAAGAVLLAKLRLVQGSPEQAREAMTRVEQLLGAHSFTPWRTSSLKAALACLWIAQGDLERASYLVEPTGILLDHIPEESEISFLQEPLYQAVLRLHQAQGDYEAMLALSERLLHKLGKAKRTGVVIEILVLRALAFQGKKEIEQALAELNQAFLLAQPEGYVRVFLDEGESMAKLLYQARSRRVGSSYAAELLSAMGSGLGGKLPPVQQLIEPLTQRELEVLRLIEAGFSNQEIAARLVISLPTVKRHISNIYTKLGTSSRTQAVLRAKELGLFN